MARKNKQPVDIFSLFNSSKGTLAQIKEKTNSLALIEEIVQQICPDLPKDVWKLGDISSNCLLIEVKSAVWSQRFQFERNTIVRKLSEHTNGLVKKVDIKVRPFTHPILKQKVLPEKTQKISEDTANRLLEVAEKAPDKLKATLERLAKLSKNKHN